MDEVYYHFRSGKLHEPEGVTGRKGIVWLRDRDSN
jgi:hypothetical protein